MRGKNVRYAWVTIVLLALGFGVGRWSVAGPLAAGGTLDSPGPPESTYSYTLEDLYNRLSDGTEGTPRAFTEPASGPTVGTGHTLDQIMAVAPAIDHTDGATDADLLAGKTAWGLTSGQWGPITGTYPLAPVPKTGAGDLGGYAEEVGEDGHADMQRGVAWPEPRFITSTAGIVTDTLTGLIWLQDANCFGTRTWWEALSDANSLGSGSCGLSDGSSAGDWRLANVQELHGLIDYGRYSPALPEGHPFTGVQVPGYWSSTTYAPGVHVAWSVHLDDGAVVAYDKTTVNYVWPIRGGQ